MFVVHNMSSLFQECVEHENTGVNGRGVMIDASVVLPVSPLLVLERSIQHICSRSSTEFFTVSLTVRITVIKSSTGAKPHNYQKNTVNEHNHMFNVIIMNSIHHT